MKRWTNRQLAVVTAAVAVLTVTLAAQTVPVGPPPAPRAFTDLASGYTQAIVGAVQLDPYPGTTDIARVLGGIAFAPNGDVWSADCVDHHTTLHRVQMGTLVNPVSHQTPTLHEMTAVASEGGCGLTNHPDGTLYSNSIDGVWQLDASTGAPIAGPFLPGGNALGITTDPVTHNLVYPGADCDDRSTPTPSSCTIWSMDPVSHVATMFASFAHADVPFVDGLYFDATGNFLFVTNRVELFYTTEDGEDIEVNNLAIVDRTGAVVQQLPMLSEPDGVSFHATEKFVVTNDESQGTMTKFVFPQNDYSQAPPATTIMVWDDAGENTLPIQVYGDPFAAGGHRGDLTAVGPDGCIYATQGRDFHTPDLGTRYNDGIETTEDSVVKICAAGGGGFTPGSGVENGGGATLGSIAGSVFFDANHNGMRDMSEGPLGGVVISLSTGETATSASDGTFSFTNEPAGNYTVTAPASASYLTGSIAVSTAASNGPFALAAGENKTGIEFGYAPGSLAGTVYRDNNGNGVRDAGEPVLSGVTVTLGGPASGTQVSAADGSYVFHLLASGSYTVSAPNVAVNLARSTASPLSWALSAGEDKGGLDFGYKPGRLSGFAYVDANRNSVKDSGEAGISGVVITGPGGATATTGADGSYSFSNLDAATYSVSAPSTASGKARFTASPLSVTLAAGATSANNNFGYVTGSLSGFAYKDLNKNGTKDSGEPGIAGVTITGPNGATTSTASDGSYSFNNLNAGTYSVSAPGTAGTLSRTTASPLSVVVPAGGSKPNNNFGYSESVVPACVVQTNSNGGTMTFTDPGSGIASLLITTNSNFNVSFSPGMANGWHAAGTQVNYSPTVSQVVVTATRINTSQSAQIVVKATDAFGNQFSCDPVQTTVTKLKQDKGVQTFTDIPFAEHFVTIQNDNPGLRALDVVVNGTEFRVRNLDDNATTVLNVQSAMHPGNDNVISLVPRGKKGDSATVTIADQ